MNERPVCKPSGAHAIWHIGEIVVRPGPIDANLGVGSLWWAC